MKDKSSSRSMPVNDVLVDAYAQIIKDAVRYLWQFRSETLHQNIIIYMSKRLIAVLILAICISSTHILSDDAFHQNDQGMPFDLGFPNFSGSCIDSDMKAKIVQIINEASQYEGDDAADNLRYIKQQVDIRFGTLSNEFHVHLQLKNQSGFFNVLSSDKCSVIGLAAGVNSLQPDWSYLLFKSNRSTTKFFYQDGTGKGKGISPQQLYFFTHTISNIEPKAPCDCGSTKAIWQAFYQNDRQNWNLICAKSYSNRMYIATVGDQYATMSFNCVYNIYAGYTAP